MDNVRRMVGSKIKEQFRLIFNDLYLSPAESEYDEDLNQLPYKYELVVQYLPDPRIEGTFLFDHSRVRLLQSTRCIDVVIGRIKQKGKIKAGKRRFKNQIRGNRSVRGLQTNVMKSDYEILLQHLKDR